MFFKEKHYKMHKMIRLLHLNCKKHERKENRNKEIHNDSVSHHFIINDYH